MPLTSRRLPVAVVVLLVAGGVAFGIGRATAGDNESSDGAGVEKIDVPSGGSDTPALRNVGTLPGLRAAPSPGSSGGATSPSDSPPSEAPS